MPASIPVALITGAAKRVGRAIALELASAGYDIAVHYRSSRREAEEARRLIEARGRRARLIEADLARPEEWARTITDCVSGLGRLDVLVNNASTFEPGRLAAFDLGRWEACLRVNLAAPAGLAHHAAAHLRAAGGCIVNLCDVAAERPFPEYLAYSCSKAALVALTRALAVELAPDVRVNGVSPGIAAFPESYDRETRERLVAKVPLKRAGTPEDIAAAVRYLAADALYVTGEILVVDGGRSARW